MQQYQQGKTLHEHFITTVLFDGDKRFKEKHGEKSSERKYRNIIVNRDSIVTLMRFMESSLCSFV